MCEAGSCSSELGSGSGCDDRPDAMHQILEEFQCLYRGRMARLEGDPASPSYNKDKIDLLEDWVEDLNQQNRTLVETVKELETEASQRCEMLESRLVSTTSSTKQYMLQLHQLQRQVQQLMAQTETRAGLMTSPAGELTAEDEQRRWWSQTAAERPRLLDTDHRWQHCTSWPTLAAEGDVITSPHADQTNGGDITGQIQGLTEELEASQRDRDDLQEILAVRNCELEESGQEVVRLRSELEQLRSALGTGTAGRQQPEPPAEVHRLRKHCRDLVDQRNAALAELAKVKVTLMEVMEQQVERPADDPASEAPPDTPPRRPSPARPATSQRRSQRHEDQMAEERGQLVAALQGHLASARDEVALKDETLARLEGKLEMTRTELRDTTDRLAGAEAERAALSQQNQILAGQVSELQRRAEEAAAVRRRLEAEADRQLEQITELQERLLAAETASKQLTADCVQKDVEIGRQWTTISSLREALLEAKQQVEALQSAPSLLGGLLGGAVRRDVRDV